ncbi:MAG: hypothetical protein HXS48_10055 [Theionarchaea archaeon]|nr:hypothetical protein [Theionarchaea archaeon]
MYPPCMVFIENLFTDLRIRVSHNLNASGYTQGEIAHHLHVSQAMVSKYLSKSVEPSEELDEVSSEIARMINQGKDEKDILLYICQTCFRWREGGLTCTLHNLSECTVCTQLRSPEIMDEKQKVVQNVKEALLILESSPSIVKLMPEVRMNIAMSAQNASNPMEVAAVPGRLVPVHGKVTAVSDPEFGASHHLASILLKTGNRAVINIRYTEEIRSLFKKVGLSFTFTDEPADVLIDKGSFGIEPCAYIFGKDAVDAALTVLEIAEHL